LKTAKEYVLMKEEEEAVDDIDERLKEFIDKRPETGFVSLSFLLKEFRESFESPEDWVNSKWFGRALIRLDLVKNKRLVNGKKQVILKINTTNSIYTINNTNTTNTTKENKEVVFVDFVGIKGLVGDTQEKTKAQETLLKLSDSEIESCGYTREELEGVIKE
jgi:hypothetical protein